MIVTISGPVTKRCPYREEVDEGTVTLTFDVGDDEAPELHGLAARLRRHEDARVSHEAYSLALIDDLGPSGCVHVRTTWQTAGLEVTVDVPDRSR